jgi:peptidoglycan hydrolase-like protein with peptidoglycan-binding domain
MSKKKIIFLITLFTLIFLAGTSSAITYNFERDLSYGLTNDPDVKALQEILDIEGCFDYPEYTGNFYSVTLNGVKCFQEKYSIPATGYVGPITRTNLNKFYGEEEVTEEVTTEEVPTEETTTPEIQPSSLSQTISGDLTVAGNIKAGRLYQEDGDLIVNTLGSGNLYFTAAQGIYLTGRIINLDAQLPTGVTGIAAVYVRDPLYVSGALEASKAKFSGNVDITSGLDVTGDDLTVGGSNFTVDVSTGNVTTAGSLTVSGSQTLSGSETITGNLTVNGNTTLGSDAADTLTVNATSTFASTTVFTGAVTFNNDNTVSTSKKIQFRDTGLYINSSADGILDIVSDATTTLTVAAANSVNILTGNLKVGNGVPSVALSGEDAYIEGTFEVDGNTRLDGALDANGQLTLGDGGDTVAIDSSDWDISTTGDMTNTTLLLTVPLTLLAVALLSATLMLILLPLMPLQLLLLPLSLPV